VSRDRSRLTDILEHIGLIQEHSRAGPSALDDEVTKAAILRWLEVIGEAATQLSDELRTAHPDVPWSDIIGMRNVLIHAYRRVEPALVWQAVERLPDLETRVQAILDEYRDS
jgi:uncharacterized protein with HEPN domain